MAELLGILVVVGWIALMFRSVFGDRAGRRGARRWKLVDRVARNAANRETCRCEVERLTQSLARRPGDLDSLLQRGLYLQVLNRIDDAVEDFSRVLEARPEDEYVLLCRANLEIWRGETDSGLADLDRILLFKPQAAEALLLRAATAYKAGRATEAAEDLEQALPLPIRGFQAFLDRAQLRLELRNDFEGADRDIAVALKSRPSSLEALCVRGRSLQGQGRSDEAERDFREMAGRDAATAPEYWSRAYAHLSLAQFPAALRDASAALEQVPTDPEIRRLRGQLRFACGAIEEAITDAETLIQCRAAAPDYAFRGQLHQDEGRYEEAAADYRRAIELQPDDGFAAINLAYLLATCPDDSIRHGQEAVRLARSACEPLGERRGWPLATLAAAYAECGEFATAVEWEGKASRLRDSAGQEEWGFLIDLYRSGEAYRSRPHYWRDRGRAGKIRPQDLIG